MNLRLRREAAFGHAMAIVAARRLWIPTVCAHMTGVRSAPIVRAWQTWAAIWNCSLCVEAQRVVNAATCVPDVNRDDETKVAN